jgi:hypothetical protein
MWLRCQLKAPIRGGGVRGNRYSIFLLDGAWQEWYSGRGSLKGQVSAVAKGMADQIAMVCQGRRGYTPPHFYQTKPFVMLKKKHLYGSERIGYVDYRKMTTGFVFREFV